MTYTIQRDSVTALTYGVFYGDRLVDGGHVGRSDAWDSLEWFQRHYPTGPLHRVVAGWWS